MSLAQDESDLREAELRAEFQRLQKEARETIAQMRSENAELIHELRAADASLARIQTSQRELSKGGAWWSAAETARRGVQPRGYLGRYLTARAAPGRSLPLLLRRLRLRARLGPFPL